MVIIDDNLLRISRDVDGHIHLIRDTVTMCRNVRTCNSVLYIQISYNGSYDEIDKCVRELVEIRRPKPKDFVTIYVVASAKYYVTRLNVKEVHP